MRARHHLAAVALALGVGGASFAGSTISAQEEEVPVPPEVGFCQDEEGQTPIRKCGPGEFPYVGEGFYYSRLGGFDRYRTAALAMEIPFIPHNLVVLVSADDAHLVDSLVVGPLVARHPNAWMIPVPSDGPIPDDIRYAIHDLTDITMVVAVGGREAISDRVFAQAVAETAAGAGPGR